MRRFHSFSNIHANPCLCRSTYVTEQVDATRATINMVHDNVSLTVSQDEASKVEDEAKRRLLALKKLSLVVDLDQTIIHATVDPTVAEWQKDESNPNHSAVKDVRAFQLVDDGPGARGCWYYIKLRPGLKDFLENISKIYELHIYTMGTRAYAQNIANIIDLDRKIFGDRILSRDESGSLVAKNLQRLFPVDTKMVVIIDDRGDVWKWNDNLIKVTPYDFFVGIGDINSSFLPKKPAAIPSPKAAAITPPDPNRETPEDATAQDSGPTTNGSGSSQPEQPSSSASTSASTGNDVSTLEQLVSMGGGDDPTILQAQASRQDETLAAQLQDRPLLQKQKQLEAEDAAATESSSAQEDTEGSPTEQSDDHNDLDKPRHNLLQDSDRELYHLEVSLRRVHAEFFATHARPLATAQGGRIAELRGSQKHKRSLNDNSDLAMVPDVKILMPRIKRSVLDGVVIVLSGVVPLGMDIQSSDIALWAKSFGAQIDEDIGKRTTHLIAARNRTAKVRQAAKRGKGRIKVVWPQWLMDSISRWERLNELPYLINIDEGDAGTGKGGMAEEDEVLSESEAIASGTESDEDNPLTSGRDEKAKPSLSINVGEDEETDIEGLIPDDLEDDKSPVGGTEGDWKQMHDELAEFLGSDAEDSDNDSVASNESGMSSISSKSFSGKGKKRPRSENGEEAETGLPQSRKKQAIGRATSLSQTVFTRSSDSSLPTPDITASEEGDKYDEDGPEPVDADEDGGGEGDGWSDLEDELGAEMDRVAAETEEHGEG